MATAMRSTRKAKPASQKAADRTIVASSRKTKVVSEASNSSETQSDLNDYPRRRWSNLTDDYVAHLLGRLKELYKQSHPRAGAESAKGKDYAAFNALRLSGELVAAVAGWALDHQIGLALRGLEFVPLQPSGAKDHPEYLRARQIVDDHIHEQNGGRHSDFDPIGARRVMINFLRGNPGGFTQSLTQPTIARLEAEIFRKTKRGSKRGLAAQRLQLQALAMVEYRYELGCGIKANIQEDVAEKFGESVSALKQWKSRLKKTLGDLQVKRALSFARNAASQDVHRGLIGVPSTWDARYGDDALARTAGAYQKALREKG
jgi:hypothetical protein